MEGVGKLIELLNEYEKITPSRLQRKYYSESGHIMYIDEEGEDVDDYRTDYEIISKDYGFIKRLVDNDKIDLDKLKDNTSFTMLTHSIGLGCEWHTAHEGESILRAIGTNAIIPYLSIGTNAIIAYLSIQDEPIEFLISILK